MADQRFNLPAVSSPFSLLSHPAFGLFSAAGSARSEFGGLGTLGVSAALGAHPQLGVHPQLGAFPDWWRASEAPRALFHPLLALPPLFPPPFQNHHTAHLQGPPGPALNGLSTAAAKGAQRNRGLHAKKTRVNRSSSLAPQHQTPQRDQDQGPQSVHHRTSAEAGSPSASSSDCSSDDGESSSDLDDEDDDEEDGELSSDSDVSEDGRGRLNVSSLSPGPPAQSRTPAGTKRKRPSEGEDMRHSKRASSSCLPLSSSLAPAAHLPLPREEHTSVIQATGLAAGHKAPPMVPAPHRKAPSAPPWPSSKPPPAPCSSPKTLPHPSSPPHGSVTSSPAPTPPSSSPKPLSLCSSPKLHTASPAHSAWTLPPPPRLPLLSALPRAEASHQADSFSQASSRPKHWDSAQHRGTGPLSPPTPIHTNLFLSGRAHGTLQAVQDAPLALITRPRLPEPLPLPVNLSTGAKRPSLASAPATPGAAGGPRRSSSPEALLAARSCAETDPSVPMDTAIRGAESEITSSKDSDSSGEDEDDSDDSDSDGSLSESESNPESDSDGSEDGSKGRGGPSTARPPPQLTQSLVFTSSSSSTSSSTSSSRLPTSVCPFNLQLIKPPDLLHQGLENLPSAPPAGSRTFSNPTPPGPGKRRRVTDEQGLRVPLQSGWQRETRVRVVGGRLQGEVSYYAPCGQKLRQYPDVMKYLSRNSITEITRDNFSFSTKIQVGDFYEVREGPEGPQWFLLSEEQVAPFIRAMDGRRSRRSRTDPGSQGPGGARPDPPHHAQDTVHHANGPRLLRKLEAQELARQVVQIKLMRKLEKQALARAAKEARRQQAITAAEERKKKKEEMKVQKQQDKMRRVQQMRVEKALRAQHLLEERRQRREEAANAKVVEAERRSQEKELRRQQALLLKHQELERHRLDMEKERRRQHLMLMKALEARKKVEERERLRQEKREEKRLNKEKRLALRRTELQRAKEMKKPNEDMCLADHKDLPEFSRLPGLLLPGRAFSDCLMVVQFLHSFGGVLALDGLAPSLSVLQEGLLNAGRSTDRLHALLVGLLSAALHDPGLPGGRRPRTALGDHLTSVKLTGENVSEVLQIFMEAHGEQPELALSLKTKPFQALRPARKASVLAFLVNELCCSKAVVSEIDQTIESMTSLRKDQWLLEGRLRKLRSVHARRTGSRESPAGGLPPGRRRRRRQDSEDEEEEEEEEEDSEDQGDDDEEEEEESRGGAGGGKKGSKVELCEEEEARLQTASVEELDQHMEKLCQQQSQIRRKLFDSSHSLRSTPYGQDRFRRRYWLLAHCGGLLVEGLEDVDAGGCEELNHEAWRETSPQGSKVKEEEEEQQPSVGPGVGPSPPDPPPQNLFLQNPSPLSRPGPLPEARTGPGPEAPGLQAEQQLGALTESQWFSLLPRSPCDDSSVTSGSPRDASPPCLSPHLPPAGPPDLPGFSGPPPSALQAAGAYAALPYFPPLAPHPPMLALAYPQQVEEGATANPFLGNALPAETPHLPARHPDTPAAAPETAKTSDLSDPAPIPEDMLRGWWRVRHAEELQGLVAALHSRGVREKGLQKQILKHMEYLTLACCSSRDLLDVSSLEEQQVSRSTLEAWCEEEQAMQVDLRLLQQVEALEEKVASGGLQVKGWRPPELQSQRLDLVYHQHQGRVVRRPHNPLDIAVCRLAALENHIERSGGEEVAPGMRQWGRALAEVRSSAQLSLCIQRLQKSITWQRSILKACCMLCGKGDSEELLLLCDGCDQGCHTYCLRPRISSIPEGDWFCPACLAKGSSHTAQEQGQAGGPSEQRRPHGQTAGEISEDEAASPASSITSVSSSSTSISVSSSSSSSTRKGRKESRKRRADESISAVSQQDSPDSWGKKVSKELAVCRVLLGELETHQDSWPFLQPVNLKTAPGYRKVIKRPIDFSTIREKLSTTQYLSVDPFLSDVNLVFDNCEQFNEDDSEIGRAGHRMRSFLDRRWAELLQQTFRTRLGAAGGRAHAPMIPALATGDAGPVPGSADVL